MRCMSTPAHFSVLGPLKSGAETRAFLGCEVVDGAPLPDRPVVIVWLPDDVVSDPKRVARLQRETSFVTQLKHPNIIQVHGLECFEEGWARVVDFVDGEPLSQVAARAREEFRPIDPRLAARIVVDVCEAVHYAHEEGQSRFAGRPVVHGGIRPDTLMVTFSGLTKVTGYGASVLAPTQHGTPIREKFVYFAPEQIIGGKATASPATDIYAIGAVLYELLAGKPPYADDEDPERAVLTGAPPIIDAPGLEGRLGNVAATALAKRGSDRFESVEVMRDAILAALEGEDQTLPSHTEFADVVNALIPADGPERSSRRELLEAAKDPDAVTMLSHSSELPEGVDKKLFARSRPVSSVQRPPRKRDEVTVVDGRPPKTLSVALRTPLSRDPDTVIEEPSAVSAPPAPAADEVVTAGETARAPSVLPAEVQPVNEAAESTEDVPRVSATPAAPAPADSLPSAPVPVAQPVAAPAATIQPAAVAQPVAAPAATVQPAAVAQPVAAPVATVQPAAVAQPVAQAAPVAQAPIPVAPQQYPAAPITAAQAPQPVPAGYPAQAQPQMPQPQAPQPVPAGYPAQAQPQAVQPMSQQPGQVPGYLPQQGAPGYAQQPASGMPQSPPGGWAPGQAPAGSMPPAQAAAPTGWAAGQQPTGSLPPPGGTYPPGGRPAPRGFKPSAARSQQPQNYLASSDPAAQPSQAGLLANQPVSGLPPPPPPQKRTAVRSNSQITQFNKKAGDSSRSLMFLAIAALLGLAIFTFVSKEPPKGLDAPSERHALPKELVQEALQNTKKRPPQTQDDDPVQALAAAAPGADAGVAPEGTASLDAGPVEPPKPGRLRIDSDPAVSVYKGRESLGRTPISVQLPPGKYRLRFTDSKTGINVYKTYRVRAGGSHRHDLTFGTSQLIVRAPVGAIVSLNGRKLGKAPLDEVSIYEGKYLLKVQFEGMSWSERFEAPPGQRIEYKVNLK